jgi:hypothetical protein
VTHASKSATTLLGMPEFVVTAEIETDGEVWMSVDTNHSHVGCFGCGTRTVGHGRRIVKVRDLPVARRPVVLVWHKRIWRCPEADCYVRTFSERLTTSVHGRCSPRGPGKRSVAESVGMVPRWPPSPGTSAWAGTPPWKR